MKVGRIIIVAGLIVILLSAGLLAGCTREPLQPGDENAETRTYDFTGFSEVEIEDAFIASVTYADTFSINVTARENVINRVNVSVEGNTLKLGLDGWSWLWFLRGTPTAVITMPALSALKISGASQVDVQGFSSGDDLGIEVSGASTINFDDMESGDFNAVISGASRVRGSLNAAGSDFELSGASQLELTGKADDLKIEASGASNVNLAGFPADNADIELSGASRGEVSVSGELDVTLSGASRLRYSGNPQLGRVDVSGASSLDNAGASGNDE